MKFVTEDLKSQEDFYRYEILQKNEFNYQSY